MMRSYTVIAIFFLVSALCSCNKKLIIRKDSKKAQLKKKEVALFSQDLNQVKCVDIPIPLSFKLIHHEESNGLEYLSYKGNLSLKQTKLFYVQEMERLGWSIADFSSSREVFLFCKKINKTCVLSMRVKDIHTTTPVKLYLFIKCPKTSYD